MRLKVKLDVKVKVGHIVDLVPGFGSFEDIINVEGLEPGFSMTFTDMENVISIISLNWSVVGPSSCKTKICLSYVVNTMVTGYLVIQGSIVPAALV